MKKNPLADALSRARGIDQEPAAGREPEPTEPTTPAPAAGKPKRFHTTVYLDKEFYGRVKIALIEEGEDRDFNRLVNDLLRAWARSQGIEE